MDTDEHTGRRTSCIRCDAEKATRCCNAHAKMLCHWCYRQTHFVMVCECDECEDERDTVDGLIRDQWENEVAEGRA